METIQERIRSIIVDFYHTNASKFCRDCDIVQGTLSNIVGSRNSDPSYEVITKILLNRKLNINPDWLLFGTGNMQKNTSVFTAPDVSITNLKNLNDDMELQKQLIESLREIIKMKDEKIEMKDELISEMELKQEAALGALNAAEERSAS